MFGGLPSESRESAADVLRICVVTETYPPEINGVSLTLRHLVRGLIAQGHLVSLVRPRQKRSDSAGGRDCCEVIFVRGLPLPGYKGLQFGLPAGRTLRRSWTSQRPDVVYVATEGPLGWAAVSAANRLGIPVFSGFHTNYHSYSRHYRLGRLHHLVFRYLCEFHNRTVGTFVPSPDLRNRLETLGVKNVSFLGRGVDSQLFAPERRCSDLRRQWGVSDSDLAVVYVGRLAGEKKVGLAVDAFRAMKRLRDSMKLVIVGDGPLRHAMQKENPDVIFCGMQTGEQLARHYASADLFVFPSETETFGNVTLEAMASGLAVIAFDYAAAKIHIKHGETGLLVPYGDSKAFVDTSADLIREMRSLQKIRQQAREYAAALSWQHVVARFENLLRSTSGDDDTAPKSSMPPADFAMAARGRV